MARMKSLRQWLRGHDTVSLGPLYLTRTRATLHEIEGEMVRQRILPVPWVTRAFTNERTPPWRRGRGVAVRLGLQRPSEAIVVGLWRRSKVSEEAAEQAVYRERLERTEQDYEDLSEALRRTCREELADL